MCRRPINFLSLAAIIFVAAWLGVTQTDAYAGDDDGSAARVVKGTTLAAKLHAQRASASDLEVGGDLIGLPAGTTRYITREALLALPQVSYTVTDDSNFAGPTRVSGVLLEDLLRDLSAKSRAAMVVAICDDKYRTNYPRAYLAAHHPLLVLQVNGKPPSGWPRDSGGHGLDMGPYMITHAKFTPAFKILSHRDEPQIPWGVVRLEFRDEGMVFGAIAPRGPRANDAAAQAGYKIAQQNCFRCHNSGAEGGQKSGVTWTVLSALATNSPEFFVDYVRNPQSKSPGAQMPANSNYDGETMRALTAYFRALSGARAGTP